MKTTNQERFDQLRTLLAEEVAGDATPFVYLPPIEGDRITFQYNGWALVITPDGWYWMDTTG